MNVRRYRSVDAEVRAAAVGKARELMAAGWSRTAAARVVAPSISVHWNTVSNWLRIALETEPGASVPVLQDQVRRLSRELATTQAMVRELVDERGPDRGSL